MPTPQATGTRPQATEGGDRAEPANPAAAVPVLDNSIGKIVREAFQDLAESPKRDDVVRCLQLLSEGLVGVGPTALVAARYETIDFLKSLQVAPEEAPRARRCANRMGSRRAEVWVRVYRVLRPRRGVLAARHGETVEIGLGPQPVFLPTELVAPATYRLPRRPAPRPDRAALARRALVWRALLGAGALASRAELARWQGVSRARVTQVMGLLPYYVIRHV